LQKTMLRITVSNNFVFFWCFRYF